MANIQDIRAINDPQRSYMWEVDIQGLSTGAIENLSFFAKTVSIPQIAVEQIIINYKAAKSHHAGRDAGSHVVTISFWDDEKQTINKFFDDWMRIIFDQGTGTGTPRDVYGADMIISLKDAVDENVTSKITLTRCFPTEIAEVALSYDASEPIEYSITLSFDTRIIE